MRAIIRGGLFDVTSGVSQSVWVLASLVGLASCAKGGEAPHAPPHVLIPRDVSEYDTDMTNPDPDPQCAVACLVVGTCLEGPTAFPPPGQESWQCLDLAGGCPEQCKIWCPYDRDKDGPHNTEACFLNDTERNASYEDACRSCCESRGAKWNGTGHYCEPPS